MYNISPTTSYKWINYLMSPRNYTFTARTGPLHHFGRNRITLKRAIHQLLTSQQEKGRLFVFDYYTVSHFAFGKPDPVSSNGRQVAPRRR